MFDSPRFDDQTQVLLLIAVLLTIGVAIAGYIAFIIGRNSRQNGGWARENLNPSVGLTAPAVAVNAQVLSRQNPGASLPARDNWWKRQVLSTKLGVIVCGVLVLCCGVVARHLIARGGVTGGGGPGQPQDLILGHWTWTGN